MFWIIGIVLVAASAGLYFGSRGQKKKLFDMQSTETSTVKDITETASSVGNEIGKGSFSQIAEVKGIGSSDSPLSAELSGTPCLYYTMSVSRQYEERRTVTDSEGRRRTETHRGSEVVASNTRSVPFVLTDETGAITVDPSGAQFIAEKTFEEFKPEPRQGASIGNFIFNIAVSSTGGRTTLGYTFTESAVPAGRPLYVLGEASDAGGSLSIRKPSEKGKRFIVSLKSEEELIDSAKGSAKGLLIGAVAALVLGIAAFLANIFIR